MVKRVTVTLEQPEYAALLQIAVAELRNPPDQLRHILRQELERQRLWPPAEIQATDQNERKARSQDDHS